MLVACSGVIVPVKMTFAEQGSIGGVHTFFDLVAADYKYHYSKEKLKQVGIVLGISGVMANTKIDNSFRDHYQDNIRGDRSDNIADVFTTIGDASQMIYSVPLYLGSMWLGKYLTETSAGPWMAAWGSQSLRTLLIGAPQQFILTNFLGSSRPTEGDSNWDLFNDNNGVSGHAFYGAVPLLTAASVTRNTAGKVTLYALSVFPGLARINDDKHYLSQVFLGWSLAYLAVDSVNKVGAGEKNSLSFYPVYNGVMVAFRIAL